MSTDAGGYRHLPTDLSEDDFTFKLVDYDYHHSPLVALPTDGYDAVSSLWLTYVLMSAYGTPGYYLFDEIVRADFERMIQTNRIRCSLWEWIGFAKANQVELPANLLMDIAPSYIRPGLQLPSDVRRRLIQTAVTLSDTVFHSPVEGTSWWAWGFREGTRNEIGFAFHVLNELQYAAESQSTPTLPSLVPTSDWPSVKVRVWERLRTISATLASLTVLNKQHPPHWRRGIQMPAWYDDLRRSNHERLKAFLTAGGFGFPGTHQSEWRGLFAKVGVDLEELNADDVEFATTALPMWFDIIIPPQERIVQGLFPLAAKGGLDSTPEWINCHFRRKQCMLLNKLWGSEAVLARELALYLKYDNPVAALESLHRLVSRTNEGLTAKGASANTS